MNRRIFLKYGVTAGATLAGLAGSGCAGDLRSRLVTPEQKGAKGLTRDERAILFHASLAPSGHNSQPWSVRREGGGQWVIGSDPDRWLRVVDPENREVLLSIGAFVENLVQAAAGLGVEADLEILANERFDRDVVRVRLLPGKKTRGEDHTLDLIRKRRTVKTGLLPGELTGADVKRLEHASGGGLFYFPSGSRHAAFMAAEAVENFKIQFSDDRAMAEAAKWTRLSDGEAERFRDGLTPGGMEIHGLAGWWVRHFMDSRDVTGRTWREKAVEKAAIQVREGAGWMVLTSPGSGVADLLDAGRRFQRTALAARRLNIGIHPMTQTLEEGQGRRRIRENHEPSMIPQFMLRVGYVTPYPAPVSLRRPVSWFFTG